MQISDHNFKIFGGTISTELVNNICNNLGVSIGKSELQRFSDGEMQPIFTESVRGSTVFLVQSTVSPSDNLLELLLMIDAAKRASAKRIVAVIPYFGYSRQDRKDKPRMPIGAKLVANLLSTAGANRIITMDLHSPQVQGFFDIPVDNIYGSAIFIPYLSRNLVSDLVFASPDVGSTVRTRVFAKYFNVEMVICDKYRLRANEILKTNVIGNVEGKNVILIDDIIDTGNTLCKSAEAIMNKGAKSVRAMCTHPILSGKAIENIENSVLDELIICDTVPTKAESSKIKLLTIAPLLSTTIQHIIENKSISKLFEY